MAVFTQIELFRNVDVSDRLHQINLVNPWFSNTSSVNGDWFCRTSEWYWTGGTGYAQFTDDGIHHEPLIQTFPNQIHDNLWYDVTFTVSNMTHGSLDVYMGYQRIFTVEGPGTYTIPYWSASGSSLAENIWFLPSNLGMGGGFFNGRLDTVSIIQNKSLSPPTTLKQWEPIGLLDMYGSERLGLTYQVSDVRSITKRFGAYSKVFKLPGTPNNKLLLGSLHSNEAQPRIYDPRNKTKCILLADTVPALKGYLSLKNVTTQGDETWYEVEVYDGVFGLVDALKGKKMSSLDLSQYQHQLTRNNIAQTWSSGWTWHKGYYYPLYLNFEDRFHVADDFKPAFFNRALLDRIFVEAGYSYTMSPALEAQFNELLTCPTSKPKANTQDLQNNGARASSSANTQWHANNRTEFGNPSMVNDNHQWQMNVEESDPMSNFLPNNNLWFYVAPFTGKYSVEYSVKTTITGTQGTPTSGDRVIDPSTDYSDVANTLVSFDVWNYQNNSSLLGPDGGTWQLPYQYYSPYSQNRIFSAATQDLDLVAGQIVCVYGRCQNRTLYYDNIAHWGTDLTVTVDHTSSYFSIHPSEGYMITEYMQVVPQDWLGNLTQQQFIDDAIKAFNLYILPDPDNERRLNIFSREELYATEYIIDRSGKVALDEEIIREYLSEVSASKMVLGYREPKDDFNEHYEQVATKQYGDREFYFNTDIFTEQTETRLQCYTPCPITRDDGGRFVPAVLSRSTESDVKLLVRGKETYSSSVLVTWYAPNSGSFYTTPYDYYRPTLHIDAVAASAQTFDMNFGEVDLSLTNVNLSITSNNLFNAHYSDQLAQYRDGRLFTVMMNLSVSEILEHITNIGARIFVQELGNWFVLYSIIDFDPTLGDQSLTKVQLLESPPSDRRIAKNYFRPLIGITTEANPVKTGAVRGPSIMTEISGVKTSVFNTNIGPNIVKGYYNTVNGSGNTIGINANYNEIRGDNNTIGAGVSGVTIIGGATGLVVNTSNTTYIGNTTTFAPSGVTFFGSSGVTIGSDTTSFYGPSGVSISSTAITINGVVITSASTDHTKVQAGLNITTGGTESRPIVNVVGSPSFTAVTATSINAGTILSGGTNINQFLAPDLQRVLDRGITSVGRNMNVLSDNDGLHRAGIITSGYAHTTPKTGEALLGGIVGGRANQLGGSTEGAVIVGCSGVTATTSYTAYVDKLDVQNYVDLMPLTVAPVGKMGRMFFSAHTGLMIYVGSWQLVTAV